MQNPSSIDSTAKRKATPRGFVLRLALFASPILLTTGLIEGYFWRAGETWPVNRVLDLQARRPSAVWMRGALDQSFYAYKWTGIQRLQPRVLAVGSSRVMKFRSPMLAPTSGKFYNAGGIIQKINDLDAFATSLTPAIQPKVIFLGIDMWWLNPAYHEQQSFDTGINYDGAYDWKAHLDAAGRAVALYKQAHEPPKANLEPIAPENGIGFETAIRHRGFDSDGYFRDGIKYTGGPFVDYSPLRPLAVDQVRQKSTRFVQADKLSPDAIALLRRALKTFRRKGILVCTFLPPVTNEVATQLETVSGQSALWHEYLEETPRICREEGTYFVDASTPKKFGLDDRFMVDGIHSMDTFEVMILREWLKNKAVRDALPGTNERVAALLAAPRTNRWFPDYSVVKDDVG